MIQILYFGRLREELRTGCEQLEFTDKVSSVGLLVARLCERGETWNSALNNQAGVLTAVNQEMAGMQTALSDGDEVAIFPPVTGG